MTGAVKTPETAPKKAQSRASITSGKSTGRGRGLRREEAVDYVGERPLRGMDSGTRKRVPEG